MNNLVKFRRQQDIIPVYSKNITNGLTRIFDGRLSNQNCWTFAGPWNMVYYTTFGSGGIYISTQNIEGGWGVLNLNHAIERCADYLEIRFRFNTSGSYAQGFCYITFQDGTSQIAMRSCFPSTDWTQFFNSGPVEVGNWGGDNYGVIKIWNNRQELWRWDTLYVTTYVSIKWPLKALSIGAASGYGCSISQLELFTNNLNW